MRTKYDRMFERKNQNILSEHYSKLVDHGGDGNDSEDDFITLKRADHDLEDVPDTTTESGFTSKRKARMSLSKKALAKYGEKGHKLVFDDDGQAHEVYEMQDVASVFKDEQEVREAGKRFAEAERGRLQAADVTDKAEAKEKKREKKRKRKEREREVRLIVLLYLHPETDVLMERRARDIMMTARTARERWVRRLQSSPRTMGMSPLNLTCHRSRREIKGKTSGHLRLRSRVGLLRRLFLRWRMKRRWHCRCCGAGDSRTDW